MLGLWGEADSSICCPDAEPPRGPRTWWVEKEPALYHWQSCTWKMGLIPVDMRTLLQTPGLDRSDSSIRGSMDSHRLLWVQGDRGCCCGLLAVLESRAAGELLVGSQAPEERERRVAPRQLVLVLLKLTQQVGGLGLGWLGDTPSRRH